MPILSRRTLIAAGGVSFGAPALLSATGAAAAQASFVGHPAVKAAMTNRQHAVINVGSLTTGGGVTQTLVLLIDGQLVEVHARRGATYFPKRPGATSAKVISPADFNRLIAAAGGVGQWVRGTAREAAFLRIYNNLGHAPAPACPADFAAKSAIQKAKLRRLAEHNAAGAYQGCFPGAVARNAPTLGGALRELFGAMPAHAEDHLLLFSISSDNFFSSWNIEYNEQDGYYGFNVFGVRAVWAIG